jgi:hypothetical protein
VATQDFVSAGSPPDGTRFRGVGYPFADTIRDLNTGCWCDTGVGCTLDRALCSHQTLGDSIILPVYKIFLAFDAKRLVPIDAKALVLARCLSPQRCF